ncbi:MAG: hypothetical protein QOD69_2680 [Solirubrobacteraceae bacterium]|jgi:hypothetical protein|nr:hypothetical protein [Solirubrobacteraceae bacterium]
MSIPRRQLVSIAVVLVAMGVAVVIFIAAASAATPPKKITAAGVGGVKLGRTYTSLRVAGLLGAIGPGCLLAGRHTRSAPLRLPLKGSVDLTTKTPRRVAVITVSGGATARGVGIGARSAAIRAAFPKMRLDHGTEDVFGIIVAHVPKGGGGPLEFAIAKDTGKVMLIAVPRIAFCD